MSRTINSNNKSDNILLYSTLLCFALPCPALLYSTLPCFSLPCSALLYSTLLCPALPCYALLHSTLLFPALPCSARLDSTLLCPALSCYALHRTNPTAVGHRCAQRCDSENEHSAVTAKTSTALRQR